MASAPELSVDVRCVWTADAVLGEGPVWHVGAALLFWLDIKGRRLFAIDPQTQKKRTWRLPLRVGSIAFPPADWPRPDDDAEWIAVAGTEDGFAWLCVHDDDVFLLPIADPETDLPGNRFNDGKMGPDDRFYAGTMDDAERQATGSLYALDKTGRVTRLDSGYMVTNGPAFSPDGRIVYHTDSARQCIFRFHLREDGTLSGKEVFRRYAAGEGYPDGMTTDSTGNLWVAMWDGWRIERLNRRGETEAVIRMPVARPTSCCLAPDGARLFVTSAAIGIDRTQQPLAGGLFQIDLHALTG